MMPTRFFTGRGANLNSSENDYDWLGSGIYFWEEGPKRALEWAQRKFGFEKAAVIGAKAGGGDEIVFAEE